QLAVGSAHVCVVKSDGTVWCWGDNTYGQLGDTTTNNHSSPVQVPTAILPNAVEVTAGENHTCARRSNGTLWCWGRNANGQLGDNTVSNRSSPTQVTPANTSSGLQIRTGTAHTCAIKGDGSTWCWGNNNNGQLGDNSTSERHTPVKVVTSLIVTASGLSLGSY